MYDHEIKMTEQPENDQIEVAATISQEYHDAITRMRQFVAQLTLPQVVEVVLDFDQRADEEHDYKKKIALRKAGNFVQDHAMAVHGQPQYTVEFFEQEERR